MESSAPILKRLCTQITGLSEEHLLEYYHVAVAFLKENSEGNTHNLELLENQICIWLNQENRHNDARKIFTLFRKIRQSKILKKKSAIIYFFMCLYRHSCDSSISQSEASHSSSFLINSAFNGFEVLNRQLPSLGLSSSRGSSDCTHSNGIPDTISSGSPSFMHGDSEQGRTIKDDKREGRVARLAAMYKEGAKTSIEGLSRPPSSLPKSSSFHVHPHPTRKTLPEKDTRVKVNQIVILREVLFAFQGIEGKIIKLNASENSAVIDPQVLLSPGEKDSLLKLAELGFLHNQIKYFCESRSQTPGSSNIPRSGSCSSIASIGGLGLVNQSLVMALKEELNEYCRLIAVLESQMQESETKTEEALTLRRLLLWTVEPRSRLRTLSLVTHAAQTLKGGACISEIYKHLHNGNPTHHAAIRNILSQTCQPIFVMLTQWLLDGTLQDPHLEFFIAADPTVPHDKLWHQKYDIRWCMLPSFISKIQARLILAVGKSHNFLHTVCNFKGPITDKEAIKKALHETTVESLFTHHENNKLDDLIYLTFHTTSSHVLKEILSHHNLLAHLRALQRFLLLGQGDFIRCFLGIVEQELSRPAGMLHRHNLSSLLENAVMASNAQHEDPDILRRLDITLLQHSPGEVGWDVFSLDYHVDGPIGTVLTPESMQQYMMLFISLWKAKHMEWILSSMWKKRGNLSQMCRGCLPELNSTLFGINFLLTEMIHLVKQMAYYTTFEVLECSWHLFMKQLKSAESLDDIINAHAHFLKRINAGALLDEDRQEVRTQLRLLYDSMMRLEALQERLTNAVIAELAARRAHKQEIAERTARGEFGLTAEIEVKESNRKFEFTKNFVPTINRALQILRNTYQNQIQEFLLLLTQDEDENLNLLCSRIDFNGLYYQRDHRLNLRLTYLHKRKSMGNSFCQ